MQDGVFLMMKTSTSSGVVIGLWRRRAAREGEEGGHAEEAEEGAGGEEAGLMIFLFILSEKNVSIGIGEEEEEAELRGGARRGAGSIFHLLKSWIFRDRKIWKVLRNGNRTVL